MNRTIAACLLFVLLCACGGAPSAGTVAPPPSTSATSPQSTTPAQSAVSAPKEVLYIQEPYLDAQCRDIITHPEDYADKIIVIQGMYYSWEDEFGGGVRHSVMRYCPNGCCGPGMTGFEIFYEGERPNEKDWIEVTGSIELKPLGQYPLPFPVLVVSKLEIKNEERGNETVPN